MMPTDPSGIDSTLFFLIAEKPEADNKHRIRMDESGVMFLPFIGPPSLSSRRISPRRTGVKASIRILSRFLSPDDMKRKAFDNKTNAADHGDGGGDGP